MKRNFWYLIGSISCLLLAQSVGLACRCADTAPERTLAQRVLESKDRAKVVFSGKAIAKETIKAVKTISEQPAEVELVMMRFKVDRWWKGDVKDEVVLFTGEIKMSDGLRSASSCDYDFEIGKSYLIYAYEFEDQVQTDYCSRTRLLEKAEEDLKELGEGKSPIY